MKYIWTAGVTILFGMSVMLTGCQSTAGEKKQVTMGRYLEERIQFEGVTDEETLRISFFENKEGNVEALGEIYDTEGKMTCKFYAPSEDNLWRQTDEALSRAIASKDLDCMFGIKKDKKTGELYLMGGNERVDEAKSENESIEDWYHFTPYVARIKEDSTLEEVAIEWKDTNDLSSDFIIEQDYLFIYLYDVNVVQQYDLKTGKFVKELGENICEFTILKDKMYAFNWAEGRPLERYDIKTGKLLSSMQTIGENQSNDMMPTEDEKGIYIINQEGIYYLAENEEIPERVLDGNRYTFSTPQNAIMDVCMSKGMFYMRLLVGDGYTYRQYAYHDDIPLEPEKTLTVFSLEDCPALKSAAQIYMEKHPDVYVAFNIINQTYEPMDTETQRQAIEAINTQILAGDVADVMLLDGLPIESYIEKGILGDMSSILNEIQKNGSFYDNLMHTYQENDKVYALPTAFSLLSAVGESELLKKGFSLEKMADYQRQHPEKQVLGNMVPEDLVKMMSSLWYSRIIGSDGKVDTKQLTIFLEAVNTLAPMKEGMTDCYYDNTCFLGTRTFQAMDKEIKVILEDVTDSNDLQIMMYAKEQLENGMIAPCIEGEKNLINLHQIIGISATSDKKQEIQELLSIVFSNQVSENYLDDFSVKKETAESMILGEYTRKVVGSSETYSIKDVGSSFGYVKDDGQWAYKDILKWYTGEGKYYIDVLKDAKALKPVDNKILSIIQQESEDYFKGNISVDEAATHIKEKLELYLSEQNP